MLKPEQHKQMAALLREAEKFLWDGESAYVSWLNLCFTRPVPKEVREPNLCGAICLAAYSLSNWQNEGETHKISVLLRGWLHKQLNDGPNLSVWLKHQGIDAHADIPKLQATRKAWLHHMIAVLEA